MTQNYFEEEEMERTDNTL